MKKPYLLHFFLLFYCSFFSQTTIIVGSGTTSSTSFDKGNPIYRSSATSNFNYSQSVQLIDGSDLIAAGIPSGGAVISKIGFYKTNEHTLFLGRTATLKVYLKNSNATTLVGNNTIAAWTTGATLCYNNTAVISTDIPNTVGWVDFNLSTPFNYSGGAIEVVFDWSINPGVGNATTGSFLWQYADSTFVNATGIAGQSPLTDQISTTQTRKFNAKITYSPSVCAGVPNPGNTISTITTPCPGATYSSTLSLQNQTLGSNVTFQWYNSAGIINGATNATYIANIISSSSYYCAVTCNGNTTNSNAVLLAPLLGFPVPVSENFNTFLPTCWSQGNNGDLATGPAVLGNSNWVSDNLGYISNAKSLKIYLNSFNSLNDWIITPTYAITNSNYELKLDAFAYEAGGIYPYALGLPPSSNIQVLVSTNNVSWTPIYTFNNTTVLSNITPVKISLSAYNGQNIRIAFKANKILANEDDVDFFIDNFEIREQNSCPALTSLTTSAISPNGVTISWNNASANGATGYEYAINNSSIPPASGTATTNTTETISTLTAYLGYYAHVRPTCGSGNFGDWTSTFFRTPCGNISTFPDVEPFNQISFSELSCWESRTNGNLTTGPGAYDDNAVSNWVFTNYGNELNTSGIGVPNVEANTNAWILSPNYILPSTPTYEVFFDTKVTQSGTTTPPTSPWDAMIELNCYIQPTVLVGPFCTLLIKVICQQVFFQRKFLFQEIFALHSVRFLEP